MLLNLYNISSQIYIAIYTINGKVLLLVILTSRNMVDIDKIKHASNDACATRRAMNSVTFDVKVTIQSEIKEWPNIHTNNKFWTTIVSKSKILELQKNLFKYLVSLSRIKTLFFFFPSFSEKDICNIARCLLFTLIILHPFRNNESDLLLGLTLFVNAYKYDCYVVLFVFNLMQINLQCTFGLQWNLVKLNILGPHRSSHERKFKLVQHSGCLFKYVFSHILMTSKHMY